MQDKAPEGDRVVVHLVAGGKHEGNPALAGAGAQLIQKILVFMHLGGVPAAEFMPSAGIMPEPAAQTGAGGDVLHPCVKGKGLLGDRAGPKPVDKDAGAVIGGRRFVSPL